MLSTMEKLRRKNNAQNAKFRIAWSLPIDVKWSVHKLASDAE